MADAVVCTLDLPAPTNNWFLIFVRHEQSDAATTPPSAVIWYVGVRGISDTSVAHHSIHLAANGASAFDALLKRGQLVPDPLRLVTVPSLDDLTLAPDGCFNAVGLGTHSQSQRQINWATEAQPLRDRLHKLLAQHPISDRGDYGGAGIPPGLAGSGNSRGTPFAFSHLRPDRTVPPV